MITTIISKAVSVLRNGDLAAIPTETVYGLAGNAYDELAVHKIFQLKRRPYFNPLIVHIKSTSFLTQVAQDIPEEAFLLAQTFWPGPLTLVLNKKEHIPSLVTAGKDTVAIRVPNHPLTLDLLEQLDFPLAAPSANPFGSISPTSASHVFNYFEESLPIILDGGDCEKGLESTIISFEDKQAILLRHGAIAFEDIEKIVGNLKIVAGNDSQPIAPGMLSKHYSPHTETFLTNNVNELVKSFPNKKIGLLLFNKPLVNMDGVHQEILSATSNMNEAAKNLYAALHRLDEGDLDVIIAERLPDIGLGMTINDRLQRATSKET